MKNYLLTLIIIGLTTVSFGRTPKKVEIKGTIENSVGKTLYLNAFINNAPVIIDSVVVKKNGKFRLAVNVVKPDFYSIGFTKKDYALLVLDSANTGETVNFNADGSKIMETYSISGSKDSEIVKSLVIHLSDHSKWKAEYSNNLRDPKFTPQQQANTKSRPRRRRSSDRHARAISRHRPRCRQRWGPRRRRSGPHVRIRHERDR